MHRVLILGALVLTATPAAAIDTLDVICAYVPNGDAQPVFTAVKRVQAASYVSVDDATFAVLNIGDEGRLLAWRKPQSQSIFQTVAVVRTKNTYHLSMVSQDLDTGKITAEISGPCRDK